jgi:L-amino acid N-acyltransferase YncA
LKYRIAHIDDLPIIVEIYNQAITSKISTADITPISVEDRAEWFSEHIPNRHPIFIAEKDNNIMGWCSLSAYRPGRGALRYTAEISYYISGTYKRQGVATELINHAIRACPELGIKNLIAIVLERNEASIQLLNKLGFKKWGYLPRVADIENEEIGHYYYGKRVWDGN